MQNFNYFCVDKYALTDKVNNFSMTYKHLDNCWNLKVPAKYAMDCLVMWRIRVSTHFSPPITRASTYLFIMKCAKMP